MGAQQLATRIIRGLGRRNPTLQRYLDRRTRAQFLRRGRIPMSPGYEQYREEFIDRVLNDQVILVRFRTGAPLPPRYGVGIDERCIEYPWLFARLPATAERLLDAGSILNHRFLIDHPTLAAKKLHILTLAPEHAAFWQRGIAYLYEDLRAIPIRDELYDTVICISTLEHVGLDASYYTRNPAHRENHPDAFVPAIQELRRVLRPGGRLYLTVPYGVPRNIGSMQVFDAALLARAIEAFAPAHTDSTYYRYTAHGWQVAGADACATAEYVECYHRYNETPESVRPAEFPREPDLAAAARAVACLVLAKDMEAGRS
jgi:SAM-dependent methyltransferase